MRRVLGNFWLLLRGKGVAALMALAATTLTARILGPAEFGLVVLVQAYTLLVRGLLNFRSFEAVVRYGVPAHDAGDTKTLHRLIEVCRRVDFRASIVATILGVLAAPFVGLYMGMSQDNMVLLTLYSFVLLTTAIGTGSGILRLLDRFDILGRQMIIGPTIRFFGVLIAWWLNGSLKIFVLIWAIAYASENIYLSWRGFQEYYQRIGHPTEADEIESAKLDEFDGLRHFLWVNYWQSNMDLVPKQLAIMLTGFLLGPAEAGLLRLAREMSSMLSRPAVLIRQVVFADLTRSWHQGSEAFNLIAYRTAMLAGAFGLFFVIIVYFFGELILNLWVGKAYMAAAPVLTLMLLAATFDLTASPLRSAAYAIGDAVKVLHLYVASTLIYLVLFIALTAKLGLLGAGMAASVAAAVPLIGIALLIRRAKR